MSQSSAYRKGFRFLSELIQCHSSRNEYRLPTVRVCAQKAGVSVGVMAKAAHSLRDSGMLIIRPRSGMRLSSAPRPDDIARHYLRHIHTETALRPIADMAREAHVATETMRRAVRQLRARGTLPVCKKATATTPGAKWKRLADYLLNRILRGYYAPGSALPTLSELSMAHGVSQRTMRKALDLLLQEQVLEGHGSKRYVANNASTKWGSVLLIARGARARGSAVMARHQQAMRALDRECARRGLALSFAPHSSALTDPMLGHVVREEFDTLLNRDSHIGSIILASVLSDSSISRLAHSLVHRNKPVAILDDTGEERLRSPLETNPLTRLFALNMGARAGAAVARHLIAQGHRGVVFFSLTLRLPWSRSRLDGLRKEYARAGMPDAVHAMLLDSAAGPAAEPAQTADREILEYMRSIDSRIWKNLRSIGGAAFRIENDRALSSFKQQFSGTIRHKQRLLAIEQLVLSALRHRIATAWVAENDALALLCMECLERIPGNRTEKRPALAAFDNTIEAIQNELTSYDFDYPGAVSAMMGHLLNWQVPAYQRASSRPTTIPGFLCVRASTRER